MHVVSCVVPELILIILLNPSWHNIGNEDGRKTTAITGVYGRFYRILFNDELDIIVEVQASLTVKLDAMPKFCGAQTAPYALHDAIEKDLSN